MSTWVITVGLAFIFAAVAFSLLSIAWFFGRSPNIKGSCGGFASKLGKEEQESCENSEGCSLCSKGPKKETEEEKKS